MKLDYSNANWSNAESSQAKGWVQEAVRGLVEGLIDIKFVLTHI